MSLATFGIKKMTIRKRIACGYAVVLGIAIAGTTAGLAIGNASYRQATAVRQAANEERKLIDELKTQILFHRPAKQIGPHLDNREAFQREMEAMLSRLTTLEETLQRYNSTHTKMDRLVGGLDLFAAEAPQHEETEHADHGEEHDHDHDEDSASTEMSHDDLHRLLEEYEVTVSAFMAETKRLANYINALDSTPEDLNLARDRLLQFERSLTFQNFIRLPERLTPFRTRIAERERIAEMHQQQAIALQNAIILGSAALSAMFAGLLAMWTSRSIARPLAQVTEVARRVTQEKNFDLQAPIKRQDEVGILAGSLNTLIGQVKHLLTQVEQKNTHLSEALSQLEQQQIQLVQSEKMSSLGQLVAGVAHEINNPINFIHGNISHVKDHVEEVMLVVDELRKHHPEAIADIEATYEDLELDFIQEDLGKILASMRVGTDRIRQIVLTLRNFSRLDEAEHKAVDLHEGLESSLMILAHRLKAKSDRPAIEVIREYGELPMVECFPGQLNQVVINLLTNAIDAIEERHFNTTTDQENPPLAITLTTRPWKPGWVELVIQDTGIGMSEEVKQRLFDAFFTTKPEGIGTGIGMSISYKIITETHHGEITFESVPNQGTTFFVRIPIQQRTTPDSSNPAHNSAQKVAIGV